MAALDTEVTAVSVRIGNGAVGLGYSVFGFELYREEQLILATAYRLSDRLGIGVTTRRLMMTAQGLFGRGWTVFDVGMQARLGGGAHVGIRAWNVGGMAIALLGQGGSIGVAFKPAVFLTAVVEMAKEAGTPTGVGVGGEYKTGKFLILRVGAGGGPERTAMGVGIRRLGATFDYAALYHIILGVTHRVSISFSR